MLRRSAWMIWLTLLLTLLFLSHIRTLQFDTSPSTLILSKSARAAYYERITRIFGNDQVILIGINRDHPLSADVLKQLRDLTTAIGKIDGIKRIVSLANVQDIRGTDKDVQVEPLIPADLNVVRLDELRHRLLNNPFYRKNLISEDEKTLGVLVFLENFDKGNSLLQGREVTRQVRSVTQQICGPQAVIGGLPEMELQGTENMTTDLRTFTPLTVLLVIIVLTVSFRCMRGVLLPLGVIALAVVWTVAALAWSGRPLKVTTVILPSLLISNGASYVIHFLAQYYRILGRTYEALSPPSQKLDRTAYRQALVEAVTYTHSPIFISAATTMAGFAAFIFSGIPAIRDLGIFATLGVFLSYLLCVLLVPSILWFMPIPALDQLPGQERSHRHIFLDRLGKFDFQYAIWVYLVALLATAWAIMGGMRLRVRSDYLAYFHKDAPVVRTAEFFHERLAGIATLFVVIESKSQRLVTEPGILAAMGTLQQSLNEMPGVDATLSFVDTVKLLNRSFHNESPAHFALPHEQDVLNDLIEFAESDPSGLSGDFLASDHRLARIVARTNIFSSSDLQHLTDDIEKRAATLFPPDIHVQATGSLVLMNQTSNRVASEQAKSLLLSVLLISIIVILLFRSWKMGLIAIIPAGLPVLLCFGLMGWTGITLNVNTSLIANIAIGIAVNNCVHYLVHFQRNTRKGLSIFDSTIESLRNAGAAMLAASVALTLGFLVFGFSRFVPVSQFGLLTAFIMAADLLANILLLPALMRFFAPASLDSVELHTNV
jgi:predicted RND superfamily exporter protein